MSDCCQQVAIDLVKNLLKISKEVFNFCYCWNAHLSTNPVGSRAHAMFLPIPTNANFNQKQLVLIWWQYHFLIWLWFDRLLYKWQGLALGQFWRCTCPSFQAEWETKWFLKGHCNKKNMWKKKPKTCVLRMYLTVTVPPPAISDVSELKRKHEGNLSQEIDLAVTMGTENHPSKQKGNMKPIYPRR